MYRALRHLMNAGNAFEAQGNTDLRNSVNLILAQAAAQLVGLSLNVDDDGNTEERKVQSRFMRLWNDYYQWDNDKGTYVVSKMQMAKGIRDYTGWPLSQSLDYVTNEAERVGLRFG